MKADHLHRTNDHSEVLKMNADNLNLAKRELNFGRKKEIERRELKGQMQCVLKTQTAPPGYVSMEIATAQMRVLLRSRKRCKSIAKHDVHNRPLSS